MAGGGSWSIKPSMLRVMSSRHLRKRPIQPPIGSGTSCVPPGCPASRLCLRCWDDDGGVSFGAHFHDQDVVSPIDQFIRDGLAFVLAHIQVDLAHGFLRPFVRRFVDESPWCPRTVPRRTNRVAWRIQQPALQPLVSGKCWPYRRIAGGRSWVEACFLLIGKESIRNGSSWDEIGHRCHPHNGVSDGQSYRHI